VYRWGARRRGGRSQPEGILETQKETVRQRKVGHIPRGVVRWRLGLGSARMVPFGNGAIRQLRRAPYSLFVGNVVYSATRAQLRGASAEAAEHHSKSAATNGFRSVLNVWGCVMIRVVYIISMLREVEWGDRVFNRRALELDGSLRIRSVSLTCRGKAARTYTHTHTSVRGHFESLQGK